MILSISETVVDGVEATCYEHSVHGHPVKCIVIDPYLRDLSAEEAERRIQRYEGVCLPILRRDAIRRGVLSGRSPKQRRRSNENP